MRMFEVLRRGLTSALDGWEREGPVTDAVLARAVEKIRHACLDAGADEEVVSELVLWLVEGARASALSECAAGPAGFRALLRWTLTRLMEPGPGPAPLPEREDGPLVVLLTGPPGTELTATVKKFARHLASRDRRTTLAGPGADPDPTATDRDVVFHIGPPSDFRHRRELGEAIERIRPHEILYVADAREGRETIREAEAFDRAFPLTGVILTNAESDVQGGTVLSLGRAIGRTIRFVETVDGIEVFRPEEMAARMLGEADEHAESKDDMERLFSGKTTLDDFRLMLAHTPTLRAMERLLEMLPDGHTVPGGKSAADIEAEIARWKAIIDAMTAEERANPEIIDDAHRRRIARESGTSPDDVAALLAEFHRFRRMFRQLKDGGRPRAGPLGAGVTLDPGPGCPVCRGPLALAEDPRTLGERPGGVVVLVTYRCSRPRCYGPVVTREVPERDLTPEERRRWNRWR